MAKKLTEKAQLLQFYKELMTEENKTEDEYGNVTYSITREDGTSSRFSFYRPSKDPFDFSNDDKTPNSWVEPTPEIMVERAMKCCRPRSFTQKELNAMSLKTQDEMVWIGNHRTLIPYLLDFADTSKEDFSCFREFIYWTELRQTNYTKSFRQWWQEIVNDKIYGDEPKATERSLARFDRYVIECLPPAWVPKDRQSTRKSETGELDLFSFLDDFKPIADYSDKPKKCDWNTALESGKFWAKAMRGHQYSHFVVFKVEKLDTDKWQIQEVGVTKSGKPFEPYIVTEEQMCSEMHGSFFSLQELHNTNSEFLI